MIQKPPQLLYLVVFLLCTYLRMHFSVIYLLTNLHHLKNCIKMPLHHNSATYTIQQITDNCKYFFYFFASYFSSFSDYQYSKKCTRILVSCKEGCPLASILSRVQPSFLLFYSSAFCTSTIASFFIGIRQFLLFPNSTITTLSSGMSITTP